MAEQFARVSGERLVNTSITGPQSEPRTVGLVGGGYVVVWTDQAIAGNQESRGQVFDNAGNTVGSEFLINSAPSGNQFQPKVAALSTGGFVVSFTDGNGDGAGNTGVRVQMFDATGAKVGSEASANQTTTGNQLLSTIAGVPGGGFLVSWQESSATVGDVRARFFNSTGAAVAGEFTVNTATANSQLNGCPAALSNGNIVIVWQDNGGADGAGIGIRAQMYSAAGATIGSEFGVNTTTSGGQANHSVTALENGGFVVTWEDTSNVGGDSSTGGIKGQVFNDAGTKVGSEFLVNTATLFAQLKPSVAALDSGGFVIAWNDQSGIGGDTQDTGSNAIKAQVFTAAGAKDGIEFLVNTTTPQNQTLPTVASLTNGGFAISWVDASGVIDSNGQGIVTQVFAPSDGTISDILLSNASVNETQPENTIIGTLSANGAITVARDLTYTIVSDSTGGGFSIKGDKLVVANNALLDFETSNSASLTLRVSDGAGHSYEETLVVAVTDAVTEVRWHAGNDIAVNTPINGDQSLQAMAALTGGGFVVTWADASTTSGDVRAQRFDADGNKLGGAFLVNTITTNAQTTPSVVGTADGGFLVVWQDGSTASSGIRGQFFEADGDKLGAEFRIDDATGAATFPEVTLLNSGNFMVVWADSAGDSGAVPAGIRGQLIDATGAKVGSEFTLNSQVVNTQADPAIATTATGFVATWTDANSAQVIRAQFFDNTGGLIGGEFQVNVNSGANQLKPTATVLASGDVLFTWWDLSGVGGDASNGGIKGRIFTSAGAAVTGELLMNTTVNLDQDAPRVTALPDGGFMLVFEDRSESTLLGNIRGQQFDGSGGKVGGEFIATYDTSYIQKVPAIALLTDGSWAISWYDGKNVVADPLGWEVEARVFSPAVATADPVATTDNVTAETGVATTFAAATLLGNDTHAFGTLAIASVTSGSGGTAVRNPDGSVTFTSTPAFVGAASFTYRITDGEGGTATGQVNVNVTGNTPPTVGANVGATVDEGAAVTITTAMLEFDDAEQADTAITYILTSVATNGTLQLSGAGLGLGDTFTQDDIANGRVSYVHDGSETLSAGFGFSVGDGDGGTVAGQSFAITVTPQNDAPVQNLPGTIFTAEDTLVALNGGVAIDPPPSWIGDVDSATVTTTLSAVDGTFSVTASGGALVTGSGSNSVTVTGSVDDVNRTVYYQAGYTPALNVSGTRTISVSTTDGSETDAGTITVSISSVKDTPEGSNVTLSATEDTLYILHASDFGFSDVDGDSLAAIQLGSAPLHGKIIDIGGYIDPQDTNGDGTPDLFLAAPMHEFAAGETIDLAVLAGGYIRYVPAANAYGMAADSFTYQVVDNGGTPSATLDPTPNTVTFDIGGINDVPALTDITTSLTVLEGAPPTPIDDAVTFTDPEDNFDTGTLVVSGVLAEDVVSITHTGGGPGEIGLSGPADVTFSGITIGSYSGGVGADLEVHFNALATAVAIEALIESLTYSNTSEAPTATRTFAVTVTDESGELASQDVQINVTPVNDAPSYTSSSPEPSYTENDPFVVVAADVTVSDVDSVDFDGGSFTITLTSGGQPGDVIGLAISNTPIAGLYVTGTDLYHDGVLIGSFTGLTPDSVTITLTAAATAAMIEELTEAAVFTSTSEDPTDTDRVVTFTFADGDGDSTDLVRTIGVTSVNDAPVNSIPAPQTMAEDTTLVFSVANGNAITVADVDSATVTVELSSQSLNLSPRGILTLAGTADIIFVSGADGTGEMTISGTAAAINTALDGLSYTPRADLHDDISIGSDQLRVATSDGTPALDDVDYVTIEVTAVDDTTPDTLTIDEDSGPHVIDVLANTSFEDPTRFIQTVSADYGQVDIDDNGTVDPDDDTITYTPDVDFNGVDVIHYYVFAGELQEEGTVTVTVNSVNDAPVFGRTAFDMRIVSVSDAGESADQNVYDVSFSADGRYVVFASAADNLVAGDTNGSMDIFVRDLLDGTTTRYSTNSGGGEGNNDSYQPALSPDGTQLVFSSTASDLVADDTNNADDLFLKDLGTGAITRVVAENGDEPDSSSSQASFSPDGTKILFVSSASNLVADDINGVDDVFVLTIATGEIERVSTDFAGAETNGGSAEAVWSSDGASIAFSSDADNLVAGDTNGSEDVFVKNLATGEVTRVSTDESGLEADDRSSAPVFSPDGTGIAFVSRAGNLLAPGEDTNDSRDIYLKDLTTGEIRRVSVDGNGDELDNDSHSPSFSPDGTHVAFVSQATNAVPGDVDNQEDLFVVDLSDGSIVLVGDPATSDDFDGEVDRAAFSPDGSQILFTSDDGGLATPDTSGKLRALLATLDPQNAVFVENGPPVQVVPIVSLTDDGDNYDGGTLTIAITLGGVADDELTLDIPSTSTGVGLERTGGDLYFDGTLIGTLGGTPPDLEIELTADAIDTAVARLAEAVRFANSGENPTAASRTVTFTLVDGGGDAGSGSDTSTFDATVEVTPINDAPTMDLDFFEPGNDAALSWFEGDGPVALAPYAVFDDVDGNATFPGATLTVEITDNGSPDDQLTILSAGDITITGNDIYYIGTLVGSFSGGTGGTALVATFNLDACHCSIESVMDNIAFEATSATPSTDQRTVTFTLNDGGGDDNGGADTTTALVLVDVTPAGEAPTVAITAPELVREGGEFETSPTAVDGPGSYQKPQVITFDDGSFVVIREGHADPSDGTFGIFAQRYDAAGVAQGGEFHINQYETSTQSGPTAAVLADGSFMVTWMSMGQDGSGYGVYARHYTADGTALANEFLVNTAVTTGEQRVPVVAALEDGGFVIAWEDNSSGNFQIKAQIYDATDAVTVSAFQTNQTGQGHVPAITSLPDGGFALAWQVGPGSNGITVYVAKFDANGNDLTGSIDFFGDGARGSIASLADGGYIVTWQADDGTGYGIFAQRFDATGSPIGTHFLVNTTTAGDQFEPVVTGLADGGFFITWYSPDGDNNGAFGQRYAADGSTVGDEVRLNADAAGDQTFPAVAELVDGGLIAVWQTTSNGTDFQTIAERFETVYTATEQVALDLRGTIAIADADSTSVTVTLSVVAGTLNVDAGTSGVTVDDTFFDEVILTGTVAQIQALLGSSSDGIVEYFYDTDFPPPSDELTVTIDDGSSIASGTRTITIIPVNDPPELDLNSPLFAGNDTSAVYFFGDPPTYLAFDAYFDDDNEDWTNATLTIAITGGTTGDQLTIEDIGGDITLSGSDVLYQGDIVGTWNEGIGGVDGAPLVITFNADACACAIELITASILYENDAPLQVPSSRDATFAFDDGTHSVSAISHLNVVYEPTPPVVDAGPGATGDEDTAIALTGITITDGGDPVTGLLTVYLSVESGTLDLDTGVVGGVNAFQVSGDVSRIVKIVATPSEINTTLSAATGLTYQGDADFTGADTLTVRAYDGVASSPLYFGSLGGLELSSTPLAVAFADLDGDPFEDYAIGFDDFDIFGTPFDGGVFVVASFPVFIPLTTGTPNAFAFGDFDGDGFNDIGFASPTPVGAGFVGYISSFDGSVVDLGAVPDARDLVAGDFDGNGLTDLAAADGENGRVAVILQDTTGVFLAPVFTPGSSQSTVALRTGDFNSDGDLDLLTVTYGMLPGSVPPGTVELLLGNGDGTFAAAVSVLPSPSNLAALAVADFDSDGVLDFAVAADDALALGTVNGVQVVFGNGDGTFGPATDYTLAGQPTHIAAGDLNGDGAADLVVTNSEAPGNFSVLLNNGDGTFGAPIDFDSGDQPSAIAIGDPDGDGDLDLLIGNGDWTVEPFNNDDFHRGVAATAGITVNALNDDPILTVQDTTVSGTEDTNLVFNAASSNAISVSDVDDTSLTVTLSVLHGTLSLAQITGLSFTTGDGAGDTSMLFSGTTANINAALEGLTYRGALNYQGADTLAVGVNDGGLPVTQDIAISLADDGTIDGDSGDNVFIGTPQVDLFDLSQGGEDTATGLGSKDGFYMGSALSAGDMLDGSDGDDQVGLQGNYGSPGAPFVLGAGNLVNIESLVLLPGNDARFGDTSSKAYDYYLAMVDDNVGLGQRLTVNFNTLGPDEDVFFDGSDELDGSFLTYAGRGNDTIIGGAQNDGFYFGNGDRWSAGDSVDGGGGADQLGLQGSYTVTFGATQLIGVESLALMTGGDARFGNPAGVGYSYNLTMNDGNVAALGTMIVNANTLRAGVSGVTDETLTFNGAAELNGTFTIFSGAGNDIIAGGQGNDQIWGGLGGDTLTGNGGGDTFHYATFTQSRAIAFGFDRLIDFDDDADKIDLPTGVSISAFAGATTGALSSGTMATTLEGTYGGLGLGQAALFTADGGTLDGRTFLLINANGVAGFQATGDFVIELVNPTAIDNLGMFI